MEEWTTKPDESRRDVPSTMAAVDSAALATGDSRSDVAAWTDAACREWLWRLLLSPDGSHAQCPSCGRLRRFHRLVSRPAYACDACGHQLAPTSGTLFHKSSTSLGTWFRAIVIVASGEGAGARVSARRLSADLDVSRGTARRMLERITAALAASRGDGPLGSSQASECAVGDARTAAADAARIVERVLREYASGLPGWTLYGKSAGDPEDERTQSMRPGSRPVAPRRGREATREHILGATCRVIVEKGMAAVRVGDIAREAGLSTAIVHYYFATKDEVLMAAVVWQNARETTRRASIVASQAPAAEKLLRFLEESMPPRGFGRNEALIRYDLWGKAMREPAYREVLQPLRREWRRQIIALLGEGVTSGAFTLSDPFDQVVEEFTAILDGYSLQYLLAYEWMTTERMWDLLTQSVVRHLGVSREALAALVRDDT